MLHNKQICEEFASSPHRAPDLRHCITNEQPNRHYDGCNVTRIFLYAVLPHTGVFSGTYTAFQAERVKLMSRKGNFSCEGASSI
jgi:hypothetical protein